MASRRAIIKKAKQFAQSVKPGETYYSIEEHAPSIGSHPEYFLHEWVFRKKNFITNQPMCGHMSAMAVFFYTDGNISARRPPGYYTVSEISKMNNESTIPLEGYDPPQGWAFKGSSDPDDLWEDVQQWREDVLKKKRRRGK